METSSSFMASDTKKIVDDALLPDSQMATR